MSRLVNEQAKMTIGSKEYIAQSQKIKALNKTYSEFSSNLESLSILSEKEKKDL